jgi:ADP-heptose:LPS heptosyltransferase
MLWRNRKINKKNTQPYKFLIIRLSSIGDIVLTTPIIRCLRKKYPEATIDFLTKPAFQQTLIAHPFISNIITYTPDNASFIADLQSARYTHIIDLHHNLRTWNIKRVLDTSKKSSFPKLNIEKWFLVNFKVKRVMPDKSIVERYFETVKLLDVINDGEGLNYFIPADMETTQDDIPMSHWSGYVACVLGGSKGTKQLPTAHWISFAEKCKLPLIMLGGPEDKEQGDHIATALSNGQIYNACGKFKLNESADLIKKAKVVVSNDTGLMHIAAAFQKPIVSLWGNTIPELGMFPYYGANNLQSVVASKSTIIQVENLSCRPCSKIGFEQCPKKHFRCMNLIDTQAIADAVYKYWTAQ